VLIDEQARGMGHQRCCNMRDSSIANLQRHRNGGGGGWSNSRERHVMHQQRSLFTRTKASTQPHTRAGPAVQAVNGVACHIPPITFNNIPCAHTASCTHHSPAMIQSAARSEAPHPRGVPPQRQQQLPRASAPQQRAAARRQRGRTTNSAHTRSRARSGGRPGEVVVRRGKERSGEW
jgi:hypothetical protein